MSELEPNDQLTLETPVLQQPGGLQLPFDRLKTPASGYQAATKLLSLEPPSGELRGVSRLVAHAAGFAALLARSTGQESVPLLIRCGNTDSSGTLTRQSIRAASAEFEIAELTTFADLEAQMRAAVVDSRLQLTQRADSVPAAISLLDGTAFTPAADLGALATALTLDEPRADLHLMLATQGPTCSAAVIYNAELFNPDTIERLAGYLTMLVREGLRATSALVSSLPLLPPEEELSIRAAGQGQATRYNALPLHEIVEAHALAAPSAPAVRFRDKLLSYGELNSRANRIARFLQSRHVKAESRIVMCLEPGFHVPAVLLGILKAGGVYVPLEPTYPPARIRTILEDTRPLLVITSAQLASRLSLDGFALFLIDSDAKVLEQLEAAPGVSAPVDPEQTAYIYYTSGTTGRPKGVMASHANLIQYIQSAQERYGFNSRDAMPAIARFSFSISMFELFSPLVAGGTLVILERDHVVDLARMTRTLQEVTFFHAGPSLLRGVLAYIRHHHRDFDGFDKVRHASSGGDMVPPEILEGLKQVFRRAEVFVIYGCSEISCMGCTYPAPMDRIVTRTFVGRPFDNVTVRVLDDRRRLVPFGVVGEICFAGDGVVKGYLDRPELTAEKFVRLEGERFYRTGDMGRVSKAGDVEILGRRDFQIQLRGMRIELGEIDYALRNAPGVKDAIVAPKPDPRGGEMLVAYVVFQAAATGGMPAVRAHMLAALPDYMVPSSYVELEGLPVNHNMKVDRRALPAPTAAEQRGAAASRVRGPETETEIKLTQLWKRVLNVDQIGLDDNFFEIGGHSMLAVELILEVEAAFGLTLEGMDVLRESLEALAQLIDRAQGRKSEKSSSPAAERNEVAAESTYFGRDESLYGVFYRAAIERPRRALLICGPIGRDVARCNFIVQKLARTLAAAGTSVFRFDYFGTGNSFGEDTEARLKRWNEDIVAALAKLENYCPSSQLQLLGIRLGATILWNARQAISNRHLIFWDAEEDGRIHLRESRLAHQIKTQSLRVLRNGRRPRDLPGVEEILGATYSDDMIRDVESLHFAALTGSPPASVACLTTAGQRSGQLIRTACEQASVPLISRAIDFDCRWTDAGATNEMLPDIGISAALASLSQESTDA